MRKRHNQTIPNEFLESIYGIMKVDVVAFVLNAVGISPGRFSEHRLSELIDMAFNCLWHYVY
jgi:hypothetical protein